MRKAKIGVFDSGVGGLSVANAVKKELPDCEVIYREDSKNVPYGNKGLDEIYQYTKPILEELVRAGCSVIVVACNTVTTNLIIRLRKEISIPLVGMEPMVKPASEASLSKVIAVCATPRTLQSERYNWLKEEYAKGIKVLEPDCSDWSFMIETNQLDRKKIAKIINAMCTKSADQIVLGCTHYHWIEDIIIDESKGRAQVLQPETPVINQLKRVLALQT
jgi:glutamate racemase